MNTDSSASKFSQSNPISSMKQSSSMIKKDKLNDTEILQEEDAKTHSDDEKNKQKPLDPQILSN